MSCDASGKPLYVFSLSCDMLAGREGTCGRGRLGERGGREDRGPERASRAGQGALEAQGRTLSRGAAGGRQAEGRRDGGVWWSVGKAGERFRGGAARG